MSKFQGDIPAYFSDVCNKTFKTAEDYHSCFNPMLYERNETVQEKHFLYDFVIKNATETNITFEPFMTCVSYGRCYQAKTIGILGESKMIKINLNKANNYKIWIHDPDYFLITFFPNVFPGFEVNFQKTQMDNWGGWTYFEMAQYNLMNRADSPCQDYDSQIESFSTCIGMNPINSTGCTVQLKISRTTETFFCRLIPGMENSFIKMEPFQNVSPYQT